MKLNPQWRGVALMAGALLLPLTAAAAPLEIPTTKTVTVKYRPSSASKPDGASQLYGTLQSAAAYACRLPGESALLADAAYQQCAATALDSAVKKVSIPAVLQLHLKNPKR